MSTFSFKGQLLKQGIRMSGIALFASILLSAPHLLTACGDDTDEEDNNAVSDKNTNANDTQKEPALSRLEFPKVKGGNSVVLIHSTNDKYGINYSVEWDNELKAQRWSAYQMTKDKLSKNATRYTAGKGEDQYPHDPLLPNNQYLDNDYFYSSGYDHGHICPSADRLYSSEANYQTFFLTNMQPQTKALNGSLDSHNDYSPWYQLESQVRTWAEQSATEILYVVKGGTIEDNQIITKIKGQLRVPKYFFVALLLKNNAGYKAIGFWMEHKSSYQSKVSLSSIAVNIRTLEQYTGIDFFCNLPDETEEHVETLPIENVRRAWGL